MGNLSFVLDEITPVVITNKIKNQKYKKLIKVTTEAMIALMNDGSFFDLNQTAVNLIGASSKNDILKSNYRIFIDPKQPHIDSNLETYLTSNLQELLEDSQKVVDFDLRLLGADSQIKWVHCWISPIYLQSSTVLQVILRPTKPQTKKVEQKISQEKSTESTETKERNSVLNWQELNENHEAFSQLQKLQNKITSLKNQRRKYKQKKREKEEQEHISQLKKIEELKKKIETVQNKYEIMEKNSQKDNNFLQSVSKHETLIQNNTDTINKLTLEKNDLQQKQEKKLEKLKDTLKSQLSQKEKELKKTENEIRRLSNRIKLIEEQKDNLKLLI
ncbi:protein networked 4a [Anaeramoeba ignava]|uniref:Protein networked 4a n=1 Tax=Anaeramoeba ignava TaxID=1746090 RepID=A0A9Q0LEC2_ANAIG|nr:protein networked 4a [Anaeramoeba ignava]